MVMEDGGPGADAAGGLAAASSPVAASPVTSLMKRLSLGVSPSSATPSAQSARGGTPASRGRRRSVRAEAAQRKFDPAVTPEHSLLGMPGLIEEGRLIGAPAMLPILFTLLPTYVANHPATTSSTTYRYISCESCSQFDSLPRTHLLVLSIFDYRYYILCESATRNVTRSPYHL